MPEISAGLLHQIQEVEMVKDIEGSVTIIGENYNVEYEPGGQTGLGTMYLRCNGSKHCTPIYKKNFDEVISLLTRMRGAIDQLETDFQITVNISTLKKSTSD